MVRFADVHEGQELPPVVVEHLTRTDLVRYAGASGDFNPIHHDEEFARAAGNPTVFAHGMLSAGFLARCITDFVGVGNLCRYKVRFATRVWPGDTITCSGRVTRKYEEAGERRIDGEVVARTQRGGVAGDVTRLDAMHAAVAAVGAAVGDVTVLVNNAGWDRVEPFVENDPALWDRLIAVNLKGALYATRAVLDGMIARGRGRIVSIASDAGRVGSSGEA